MVRHVNELCEFIFNKYPLGGDLLPLIVEYRLSQLIRTVLWHECYVLVAPAQVKLDFAKMFRVRSFFMYACNILPCGHINRNMEFMKDMHLGFGYHNKALRPHTIKLYYFYTKVQRLVCNKRKKHIEDRSHYYEVWNQYVKNPEVRKDCERRD